MANLELWRYYFTVWSGLPQLGDPVFADVIIAQSFGRNSIPDERLFCVGNLYEKNAGNDGEVLHLLLENNFDPGKPNLDIALECARIADRYHRSLICQWEVGAALLKKEPCWFSDNAHKIHCVWPEAKLVQRFTTPDVLYAAKEIMDENEWKKPILVAHRLHISRAYFLARKIIGNRIIVPEQKTASFDSKSVQWPTRNLFNWLIYESAARSHHLLYRLV